MRLQTGAIHLTAHSENRIMSVVLDNGKLDRPDVDTIVIGLVNNMPDAALEATERQFIDVLNAAGEQIEIRLRLLALPEVPREASGRRRLQHLDQFRFGELFFLAHDFCRDAFAANCEGNEERFAFIARDTFPTKSDIFDFEFDGSHRRTFAWTARCVE